MKRLAIFFIVFLLLQACHPQDNESGSLRTPYQGPIRLLPVNPHYFEYQGKPLVLITSAEHYGALLNEDFDYRKYLQTLAEEGMNYTRIFAGTYAEIPGESFGIQYNTLAPQPEKFITPWSYTLDGSGKRTYNLERWNDAYFERLHDIMKISGEKDIIVEFTLFTSIYRDEHWAISPENPINNSNIDEPITRFQAHTPDNGSLMEYQEKLVRKLVQELNVYDNFFIEIQNEPWSDHNVPVYNIVNREELRENDWTYKVDFANVTSLEWQDMIAGFIVEEESGLEKKHLIAQNYCNFKAPLSNIGDNISILNFHYGWPEAAEWNYSFDKVIGFDESGFAGSGDEVYRRQAWRFLLSGGGLFNNLDYSFFTGYEDGTLENKAPGGGSITLRKQLKILHDFIHGFDLANLKPDRISVKHVPGVIPYVMSIPGRSYALFLQAVGVEQSELDLTVPDGKYSVEWISTFTGTQLRVEEIKSIEGHLNVKLVFESGEIAIRIERI